MKRMMHRVLSAAVVMLLSGTSSGRSCPTCVGEVRLEEHVDFAAVFDEIQGLVTTDFVDPKLNALDWNSVVAKFEAQLNEVNDVEQFAAIVNDMLARLNTSHTHLYTDRDPAYFQLLSIFRAPLADQIRQAHPANVDLKYPGIGIFTTEIDGEIFISGVFEGTPAHRAGLQKGDRLISVGGEPFHPLESFRDHVGQQILMRVQRSRKVGADSMLTVQVTPELLEPAAMLLNAVNQSAKIVDRAPHRVGYIHMWTMAGDEYREALREQIATGILREADALVLDLRDGWGGANPEDLNMFHQRVPVMSQVSRDGTERIVDYQWRKPVALLVNEGSRSGKELFAFGFQKYGIGPLIGARTAGAVVGGRPYLIRPGILLYLAVADVRADGERLEGRGVTPDIVVPVDIRYSQGADPQLDKALEVVVSLITNSKK